MPKVLFDNNSKFAKTMITRTIPDNWAAMDGEQGKGLWIEHWEEEGHSIGSTTDPQITVTAKVFCISRSIPRKLNAWQSFLRRRRNIIEGAQHLCEYLRNLSLSVEVFQSETLLNFIDHWFRVYRSDYQASIIMDGLATLALTIIFMTMTSFIETGESSSTFGEKESSLIIQEGLIIAYCCLRTTSAAYLRSFRRSAFTCLFILLACF